MGGCIFKVPWRSLEKVPWMNQWMNEWMDGWMGG